jgi:hypothetical protein
MLIDRDITFQTADGFECVMRVIADADIQEEEYFYTIQDMTLIEFHGHAVNVPMDELDIKGQIAHQIDAALDAYISENSWELQQAEAEYYADLAYDSWKEQREHD